jgi:anti-sigma B factor antagonist
MAVEFAAWDEQVDPQTQLVSVRGEVDLFTAPEFKQRISGAIDAGRRRVVVDLNAATFIDSSSLGILISAHKRLRMESGSLVIACEVPAITKTFKVTGLDSVLEVVPTREEALAFDGDGADLAGAA